MNNNKNTKKIEPKDKSAKKGPSKSSSIAISVGSVIVFVLIFISFIILPGLVGSGTRESPVFGKWGTRVVRYEQGSYFNQVLSYYGNQVRNMAEQYGEFYMDFFMRQAYQQAFNETIRQYAFIDLVEKTGFTPSPNKIDRKMVDQFLDENGKFSQRLYNNTPEDEISKLQKQFEDSESASRFGMDYFDKQFVGNDEGINFALATSKNEVDFMNAMNEVKVSFDAVVFDTSDYPDSESKKFLAENPDLFNRYYFKAISVETESIAKTVLKRIKDEEITFEDAIDEYSKNYYSTADGNLKNQYEYQIVATFANENDLSKISDLQENEVSPVIKTQTGYTIFKCTQPRVAPSETNPDVVEIVSSYIKANEMGRIQDYFSVQAEEFLKVASSSSFDSACKQLGKEKKHADNFTLNYGSNSILASSSIDIPGFENVSENENFLTKLFALKANEVSEPITLENAVVIVRSNGAGSTPSSSSISERDYKQSATSQDYASITKKIFESKKFKNDFDATYAKYFTQSK